MAKRSPEELELARTTRLTGMRAWTARLLGYDPLAFAAIPRYQRDAIIQGRLAVDKARKNGARLARSMPDAEAPNPLAMQHGSYEKAPRGIDKTVVAYNRAVTPLEAAERDGKISPRLFSAGEHFERDHLCGYRSCTGRDSLDLTPRSNGFGGGESHAILARAARTRLCLIERSIGHKTYNRLVDVCVLQLPIGDRRAKYLGWARLLDGLTFAADFYRLPEEPH